MMPESSTLIWMMTSCRIDMDAQHTWAPRSLLRPTARILAALQISGVLEWFCTRCWLVDIRFTTATPSPFSAWSVMVGMLFRSGQSPSRRNALCDGYYAVIHHSDRLPARSCTTLGLTSAVGHHRVLIATISKNLTTAVAVAKTSVLNTVSGVMWTMIRRFRREQTPKAA